MMARERPNPQLSGCKSGCTARVAAPVASRNSRSDHPAGVAELADAPGLGPGARKSVEVRVLSPAHHTPAARSVPSQLTPGREAPRSQAAGPGERGDFDLSIP